MLSKSVLYGYISESAAPTGTASGDKTIQYSIGTAANTDAELTDPTDADVMSATSELTLANVHGDESGDHVAAFFSMDLHAHFFANATDLHLNFLGKASNATISPGTVTCEFSIWALLSVLS